MAIIKLSENELRDIIRKVISESKINESYGVDVEIDLETDDYIPFSISGKIYNDMVEDYSLIQGSYDPVFEQEINQWMLNNDDKIKDLLFDKAIEMDEISYDETNEYNPDRY